MKIVYIPRVDHKPVRVPLMSIAPVAAIVPFIPHISTPNIIDPSIGSLAWPVLATYTVFMAGYAISIDQDRRKKESLKQQVDLAKKHDEYQKVINGPTKVEAIDTTNLFS